MHDVIGRYFEILNHHDSNIRVPKTLNEFARYFLPDLSSFRISNTRNEDEIKLSLSELAKYHDTVNEYRDFISDTESSREISGDRIKFFGNMYNMHMKTIEQINKLTDEKFRRVFGITRDTFFFILEKLDQQYADSHKKGGRPPKINTLNRLCIFLAYYRNYRTMEDIANEYGISVSTTYDIIRLVEKTLMSCEEFKLPDKQDLKEDDPKVVVIDATECEIRRTKRGHQTTIAVKRRNIRKKLK